MKKIGLLFLLIFFVVSCAPAPDTELPPEPGTPGDVGPVGKVDAYGDERYGPIYDYGSGDQIMGVFPKIVHLEFGDEVFDIEVVVSHDNAYIWNTGYYFNRNQEWVPFVLDGETIENSNWISEHAELNLGLHADDFYDGETFVVAYSCKRENGEWRCGYSNTGNFRWMLDGFVLDRTDLPPEPVAPGSVYVASTYAYPSHEIFRTTDEVYPAVSFETKQEFEELDDVISMSIEGPIREDEPTEVQEISVFAREALQCYTSEYYDVYFNCWKYYSADQPYQFGVGNYEVMVNDGDNDELIRNQESVFKVLSDEDWDKRVIAQDIGGYAYDGARGHYFHQGQHFHIYYEGEDQYVSLTVRENEADLLELVENLNRGFDDWVIMEINGQEVLGQIQVYEEGGASNYYLLWISGEFVVELELYGNNEGYDFASDAVVLAYLEKFPSDFPITLGECVDSDGGKNATVAGVMTTTFDDESYEYADQCVDGVIINEGSSSYEDVASCEGDSSCYVKEAFCAYQDMQGFRLPDADNDELIRCPEGCSAGACIGADEAIESPDPANNPVGNSTGSDGESSAE